MQTQFLALPPPLKVWTSADLPSGQRFLPPVPEMKAWTDADLPIGHRFLPAASEASRQPVVLGPGQAWLSAWPAVGNPGPGQGWLPVAPPNVNKKLAGRLAEPSGQSYGQRMAANRNRLQLLVNRDGTRWQPEQPHRGSPRMEAWDPSAPLQSAIGQWRDWALRVGLITLPARGNPFGPPVGLPIDLSNSRTDDPGSPADPPKPDPCINGACSASCPCPTGKFCVNGACKCLPSAACDGPSGCGCTCEVADLANPGKTKEIACPEKCNNGKCDCQANASGSDCMEPFTSVSGFSDAPIGPDGKKVDLGRCKCPKGTHCEGNQICMQYFSPEGKQISGLWCTSGTLEWIEHVLNVDIPVWEKATGGTVLIFAKGGQCKSNKVNCPPGGPCNA